MQSEISGKERNKGLAHISLGVQGHGFKLSNGTFCIQFHEFNSQVLTLTAVQFRTVIWLKSKYVLFKLLLLTTLKQIMNYTAPVSGKDSHSDMSFPIRSWVPRKGTYPTLNTFLYFVIYLVEMLIRRPDSLSLSENGWFKGQWAPVFFLYSRSRKSRSLLGMY